MKCNEALILYIIKKLQNMLYINANKYQYPVNTTIST